MAEETRNSDGSVTFRRYGKEVTVKPQGKQFNVEAVIDGQPCYRVHLVGDSSIYFGEGVQILRRDGDLIWYVPNDESFHRYAANLIRLNAWAK